MPFKKISDYLYHVRIHFAFRESYESVYKYINKINKSYIDYDAEGFKELFNTSGGFVIWCDNQNILLALCEKDAVPSLVAHEIFHLTVQILEKKGIKLASESEEAYAYYSAWLFDALYSFVVNGSKKK